MVKQKHKNSFLQSLNHRFKLSLGGMVGGLLFFCLSFTPSLLPRGYVLQGVAAGLSFATGYGLAVAVAHFYHKLPKKYQFIVPIRIKQIVLGLLIVVSVVFLSLGFHWQQQVREVTQAAPTPADYPIRVLLIATLLSALFLWMGRGIRHLGRYCAGKLSKFLGPKPSMYLGGVLAAILLIFLVNGIFLRLAFGFINFSFGLANKGTPEGVHQTQDSSNSGSMASTIDWNTLGEKGREFVATGPSKNDIEKFSGAGQGRQPSRLYVGLESAPTLQERVDLLVNELDRTKAADRKAVLIAIPTGSGGINAKSVQSVEYLFDGNVSTLGIQYSYLPSWLSFLADQETARDNGKVLVEAVYTWWNHLNPNQRPKLLMYGESLGTLGADGAFSGASDMQNRMSGILLVGPPHANNLWANIVSKREAGTRQVLPTYQNGETVRFSDGQTSLSDTPNKPTWHTNRVGFIQHGSDPVVWGALNLFWSKPDWLKEQRGSDVLSAMHWYPFVTGWQVALDLPFAFGATPGHGHRYSNITESWMDVLHRDLSPEKTKQLHDIISDVKG